MFVIVILVALAAQATRISTHEGVYRGTARNAAGTLQLGNADAVNTMFRLTAVGDSVFLRANTRGGTEIVVGAWPTTRVSATSTTLSAKGLATGPLHLRRDLQWALYGGVRVAATITTRNPSQKSDDYFGGRSVSLTLMKVR